MKKMYLLLPLLLAAATANAEEFRCSTKLSDETKHISFLGSSAQWLVWQFSKEHYTSSDAEYENPIGNIYNTIEINDTVIDGKSYTRLYDTGYKYFNWTLPEPSFMEIRHHTAETYDVCGIFREDDGKIYKYDEKTQKEYLFYDFTLNVDDTFTLFIPETGENVECVVTDIDSVVSYDQTYHRLHLSTDNPNFKETTWIEGFGSEAGPLVSMNRSDAATYGTSYLANAHSKEYYYAQTFTDIHCRGKEIHVNPEPIEYTPGMKGLEFEFIGNTLHITGNLKLITPVNYKYMYCVDSEDGVIRLGVGHMGVVFTQHLIYGGLDVYFEGFKPGMYKVSAPTGGQMQIECQPTADAITDLRQEKSDNGNAIFTIQGTRLTAPQKGLNIINGKKMLVR